jgi:hypothetical protein
MPNEAVKADTALNVSSIKKLEAELAQRRDALKATLLAQISDVVVQLKELGFSYQVVEDGGNGKTRVCSVCQKEGHTKATCPNKK